MCTIQQNWVYHCVLTFFFQITEEEEEDYWNDDWYEKSYQEDDQELKEICKGLADTEVK